MTTEYMTEDLGSANRVQGIDTEDPDRLTNLVLSRCPGEWVNFHGPVHSVAIVAVKGDKVRLGIVAPRSTHISRSHDGDTLPDNVSPDV